MSNKSKYIIIAILSIILCLLLGLVAYSNKSGKVPTNDKSRYIGEWVAESFVMGDEVSTPSELGVSMRLVFYDDGTGKISLDGTEAIIVWEIAEDGVKVMETDGVEVFVAKEIDGKLQAEQDGITIVYIKEN